MNIALPTKAKMTALVCSGRSRPNEVNCRFRVQVRPEQLAGDQQSGAEAPRAPLMMVAIAKARTMRLSYLKVSTFILIELLCAC